MQEASYTNPKCYCIASVKRLSKLNRLQFLGFLDILYVALYTP